MEKRRWQYEGRPKSRYFLAMAILFAIFAAMHWSYEDTGLAAANAGVSLFNLGFCLYERRKERNGQGTLA
jgi:hypothetical protein